MNNALDMLNHLKESDNWCAIDTETTGVSKNDQVIEVAVSSKSGDIIYHELIKPTVPINPFAQKVHGISLDELTGKETWSSAYRRFEKAIKPFKKVLIYNSAFDNRLIKQTYKAFFIPEMPYESICYYSLIRKLHFGAQSHHAGKQKLNLESIANRLGIETKNMSLHTAADDAILLSKVASCFSERALTGEQNELSVYC